jgi:hypothetical protein
MPLATDASEAWPRDQTRRAACFGLDEKLEANMDYVKPADVAVAMLESGRRTFTGLAIYMTYRPQPATAKTLGPTPTGVPAE